jgi:hypothetical protein
MSALQHAAFGSFRQFNQVFFQARADMLTSEGLKGLSALIS